MNKISDYRGRWEAVIGLEVHVQLRTRTKMFTPSEWCYGDSPNTQICPITLGYPGTLPTINISAVKKGILIGLSLNCDINNVTKFSRKHYFYPDLPKGYQITQFDSPLCENGYINLDSNKKIRITRAHLEEDAGKTIHTLEGNALIDYNRCGAPLLEIVSAPDMSGAEDALEYLKSLKEIITSLKASDCDMEKGNLRVDLNISVMPIGSKKLGTRREVKNVNSFRNIEKAIYYEFINQCQIIEDGGSIEQETLLWDDKSGVTRSIRSKEDAHDYRYLPEPDLPPLEISDDLIKEIKEMIPELPNQIRQTLRSQYLLNNDQTDFLISHRDLFDYYKIMCNNDFTNSQKYFHWLTIDVIKYLKDSSTKIINFPIKPEELRRLVNLEIEKKINHSRAKKIYLELLETGESLEKIISGLPKGEYTLDEMAPYIESTLDKYKEEYTRLLDGETKLINFFIGVIMKESKGRYNPSSITKYLKEKLNV